LSGFVVAPVAATSSFLHHQPSREKARMVPEEKRKKRAPLEKEKKYGS
jgi:hypothetical protein